MCTPDTECLQSSPIYNNVHLQAGVYYTKHNTMHKYNTDIYHNDQGTTLANKVTDSRHFGPFQYFHQWQLTLTKLRWHTLYTVHSGN